MDVRFVFCIKSYAYIQIIGVIDKDLQNYFYGHLKGVILQEFLLIPVLVFYYSYRSFFQTMFN